jgi:hypothetical protein
MRAFGMIESKSLREFYGDEIANMMCVFTDSLDEKQRRLFLALEANRLGHGGRTLLVNEFSTSFSVIRQGERELNNPDLLPERNRTRRPGGGCTLTEDRYPEICDVLDKIMTGHIAGDPMNEAVRWTDKSISEITTSLAGEGYHLSEDTVKRLVKKRFSLNKPVKKSHQPASRSGSTIPKDKPSGL